MKLNRSIVLAALLAAGCASGPATGPVSSGGPAPGGSIPAPPPFQPDLNIAATAHWVAEDGLIPADPVLAMVDASTGGAPAGMWITCKPANGRMTAYLGKQPVARIGQAATYSLILGEGAEPIEGTIIKSAKGGGAAFAFPIDSVRLKTMAQMDSVIVETDAKVAQWQFVRDPAATPRATYVGSLRDLNSQVTSFSYYCNPK